MVDPTREDVERQLKLTHLAGADEADPIRLAARLWLAGQQVDEAMIERAAHTLMVESWQHEGAAIYPSPIGWMPVAERVLRAAWEVTDG